MLRNILKIFTGTFISRIFGFLRELVVASYFGTGRISDAFTFALTFPNLFRQILGEDMVERAFMPPFKTMYDKGDKNKAWKFLSILFNWFFLVLIIITFLLYVVLPLIFSLRESVPFLQQYIFTSTDFDYDLTLNLILVLLPFMLFIGLAAFVGSLLNFFERNWIFGFAPAMLSLGVIIGIFTLKPFIGGYSIAVGWVIGALLQFLIQLPFIFNKRFKRDTNLNYSSTLKDDDLTYKTTKRESKIIALNAIFNKSSEIFGRFLATLLGSGSTSSLYFAMRLYQLPFAIISLSIARGINPLLNKLKSIDDWKGFQHAFLKGLQLYYALYFPIIVMLIISSKEIIYLAYFRGAFTKESMDLTTSAFNMYVPGLLPMSLIAYYTRVLSLFNRNKYALNISIFSAIINIAFSILLIKTTDLNHDAIALASTIAFYFNMVLMHRYMKKEFKSRITIPPKVWILNLTMLIISIIVIFIGKKYFGNYIATKAEALIATIIKTLVVAIIFSPFIITTMKRKR